MAWNEPGGAGGGKDPWSARKPSGEGPPDLDEVARKLRERFGALFGGKRGDTGGKPGASGLGWLALLAIVIWLGSGIYIIDPPERGIVLRFGQYQATTLPGPHWHIPYPIETVEVVNIDQIRNVEIGFRTAGVGQQPTDVLRESLMLTQDENIIDIKLAVQYRVKEARDYVFSVRDPDVTLGQVTESVVREIVGKSKMDYVLGEGRRDIEERSEALIQEVLDRYRTGLELTRANVQGAQAPEEVQNAFLDVIRSREDEQRLINEAQTYANGVIPTARGGAARQLQEAEAYKSKVIAQAEGEASRFTQVLGQYKLAPEITRKRLYLEAMESVLSNSSKVMVDIKGGNNLLYLPLDKMMQQRGESFMLPERPAAPEGTDKSTTVAPPLSPSSGDMRARTREQEVR